MKRDASGLVDKNNKKILKYVESIITNVTIGRTAVIFSRHFKLQKLADLYSEALGRKYTKQWIWSLIQRYKKGGDNHERKTK